MHKISYESKLYELISASLEKGLYGKVLFPENQISSIQKSFLGKVFEIVHAVQHGVIGEALDVGSHGGEYLGLEEEEVGGIVEGDVLYFLVDFRPPVFVGHHLGLAEEAVHFIVLIEGAVPREAPVGGVKPVGKEELGIAVVRTPGAQGHLEIAFVRSLPEGSPGHFFQVHLDAQLLEVVLDD